MKLLIAANDADITVLRTALKFITPKKSEIDVLCVAPDGQPGLARAKRIAQAVREELGSNGQIVNALAISGRPVATIVERAADYDLTVIHAGDSVFWDDPDKAAGLGPVASEVVEHSSGPLLIARPSSEGSDEGPRILIAVDGSAASRRAVETVAEACDLDQAEISLMFVSETAWLGLEAEGDWSTSSEEEQAKSIEGALEKEFVREGEGVLESSRKLLARPHLTVNTILGEGNAGEQILAEIQRGRYDLVALGSTGNRDVRHRLLGSVSTRVAWEASCSVLIVPEPCETG